MKNIKIDNVLFMKVCEIENRSPVRKMIFSASQGIKQKKTFRPDIHDIVLDKKDIIVATIQISHNISWRYGLLRIKDLEIPDIVKSAMIGHDVGRLIDYPFLKGYNIKSIREKSGILEVRTQKSTKQFSDVWKIVSGE